MRQRCIVSLSGGLDSTTLLADLVLNPSNEVVLAVGFTYGSKHNNWENMAAFAVASHYKVKLRLVDLTGVMAGFKSDLLKTGGDIPEGHYEAETMRQTVVPGRNIIFASILAGIAWSEKAELVYLGVHAGDHYIYHDCRPLFVRAMQDAVRFGTGELVRLEAPYLNVNKSQVLKVGLTLDVPYHLTRTCYKNQRIACGKCGSCQERLAAFAFWEVRDPLEYETRELLPK
jgi:7-cyano-7-deazaguanine synthase